MKTILVIEDEPLVQANIQQILELRGFRAIAASNGYQGLKLAQEYLPDLILCDIMMAQLDGYGVMAALYQDVKTSSIPFIFLTAKVDRYDIRYGMELGADNYLTKPFEFEELLRVVETCLKKHTEKMQHLKEMQYLKTELNYQFHSTKLQMENLARLTLEASLHRAIEQQEFQIYYQPQVHFQSGAIIGAKALLGWHTPNGYFVSPYGFPSMSQQTGLIFPLEEWLLRTVCNQAKAWQRANVPLRRISISFSALHFEQTGFVRKIAQILAETNLEPGLLDLEITENLFRQNPEKIMNLLYELKEIGFQITLNDFGTGYSSLTYLTRMPVHTLKIERSFVRHVNQISSNAEIVKAIIKIGHGLNLHAIAEGVETQEEMEFLGMQSCDYMQGNWFYPPITAVDLEKLLVFYPFKKD
ncbi:EAL domain-containing protein [Scytonema sp. UIC 10036]|uniref:EAL domain-containing response regulator n=1 Tax=Scytonema sp. UIC 10036 TaxID=2304196 RepID=UPI0012DAD346|nr:EAL domain-containing response regulator [Scytonema sp. UIC 10036]MUG99755.1 EAL domain-containing protein [Scytonema sp. UIC 10036]